MSYKKIDKELKKKYSNIKTSTTIKLKDLTTFKIGGRARLFIMVEDICQLKDTIYFCKKYNKRYFILGNGSNILAGDKKLNYVFIKLVGEFLQIKQKKNILEVGSGLELFKLHSYCMQKGLSGLEWSFGVPASVGGAVYMNAGCYNHQFCEVIKTVQYFDGQNVISKSAEKLEFAYRNSYFKNKDFVILKVVLNLAPCEGELVSQACRSYLRKRIASQPYCSNSAGSIFKKPDGDYAPVLIEKCKLKGKKCKAAQISDVHCGFIVNNGKAKCKHVLKLIYKIKKTVNKKFGIMLDTEVIILK